MTPNIILFESRRFFSNRKNLLYILAFTLIFAFIFAGQFGWIDGGWKTRSTTIYNSPAEILTL